jgi:hypothetical protein
MRCCVCSVDLREEHIWSPCVKSEVLDFELRSGLTHGNDNKSQDETGKACRQKQRYEWSGSLTTDSSPQEIAFNAPTAR